MYRRTSRSCPAPSDASAISALLLRGELEALDAERDRLKTVITSLLPRRSTIVENRLKQLTRKRVGLVAALRRAMR